MCQRKLAEFLSPETLVFLMYVSAQIINHVLESFQGPLSFKPFLNSEFVFIHHKLTLTKHGLCETFKTWRAVLLWLISIPQVKYFGEIVKSKPLVQQMPFWERSAVLGWKWSNLFGRRQRRQWSPRSTCKAYSGGAVAGRWYRGLILQPIQLSKLQAFLFSPKSN